MPEVGHRPIEKCDSFALGYCGRAAVDDLAAARGEHDFHVDERDGQLLGCERARGEELVEVRRGYYLWAVGAAREQMFQDSGKEARPVCVRIKPIRIGKGGSIKAISRGGVDHQGKACAVGEDTRAC